MKYRPLLALLGLPFVACLGQDNIINYEPTPTPGETPPPEGGTPLPAPTLRIEPAELDFGAQGVGCRVVRPLSVFNDGRATLVISSASLSVASSSDFSLDGDPLLALDPGTSGEIRVAYTPSGSEPEPMGDVLVSSNDARTGTVAVPLRGSLAAEEDVVEDFTQVQGQAVDILWLVDVTASMRDQEMPTFLLNLDGFVEALTAQAPSWQMGWVSSNPVDGGDLQTFASGQRWLSQDSSADDLESFKDSLVLAVSKIQPSETPLIQLGTMALSPEKLAGEHNGFVREGVALFVVTLSVRDDTSLTESIDVYASQYAQVKGGEEPGVSFNGVIGTQGATCAVQVGDRYKQLAAELDGVVRNVCDAGLDGSYDVVAAHAVGMQTHFPLGRTPVSLDGITVRVGGQVVMQDPYAGWSLDTESNAVVFNGTSIPPAGASGEVSYRAAGLCVP